tara:strand:+ start:73727 stop:74149 length:423 start_codon:yes stop_codon:yes gene_type:complete
MSYLIDTCVLSEAMKPEPNQQVVDWLLNTKESSMFISVLTIGELRKGIERLAISKRRVELEVWFEEVYSWQRDHVLSFDKVAAKLWGEIKADTEASGKNIALIDSMIAATALSNNLMLVTRNVKDFSMLNNLVILNPWDN